MAGRKPDRAPDGRGDAVPSQGGTDTTDRKPDDAAGSEAIERDKAETEIAAGDVADDLADFA